MKEKLVFAALSIVLLSWPKTAAGQCSTYGGRATVVQANGLGITPVALSDTGNINSTGGINDASLLGASVPGLLSGEVLSATAGGRGSSTMSFASMANLKLTVAGNTIGAGFVMAKANAYCGTGVTGKAEIDGLMVNGLSVAVTGAPNQTVSLLGGGYMILNEQTSNPTSGSITVNAIHVKVPAVSDVIIGSASAAISGQLTGASGGPHIFVGLLLQVTGGPGCSFFTGGGWIPPANPAPVGKGTFGVSGGMTPGGNVIGHLEYIDHGTGMNVHGTGVAPIVLCGSGGISQLIGSADIKNGPSTCAGTFTVTVVDNDSSGGGPDYFSIVLDSTDSSGPCYSASGNLAGGDIEFHKD
jgi:hypothetical protein